MLPLTLFDESPETPHGGLRRRSRCVFKPPHAPSANSDPCRCPGHRGLLPVSSSAHVIVAEKLMGLDPTAPEMTLLLVMLHTGTMLSVIVYFWRSWRESYFSSAETLRRRSLQLVAGTAATSVVGLILLQAIKQFFARNGPAFE